MWKNFVDLGRIKALTTFYDFSTWAVGNCSISKGGGGGWLPNGYFVAEGLLDAKGLATGGNEKLKIKKQ